jgi:hypothetical protein
LKCEVELSKGSNWSATKTLQICLTTVVEGLKGASYKYLTYAQALLQSYDSSR